MRPATLILLFAASLAAQQASLDGVVLNQARGQPLPGVHIRLYVGIVIEGANESYGAVSGLDGRFSIAAMPPGAYTVEAERAGFLQAAGNGFMRHAELELRPGQHLAGYQFAMAPLMPVAGRVVNQYGDPVPGARVQLTIGASNSYQSAGPFSQKTTDERGQFRMFAPPGKYYVLADPPFFSNNMGPAEIRTDGTTDILYSATYYPDSPDLKSAGTVEVKPGSETPAVEIKLRGGAPRHNLTVSGVVTGIPAGAPATVAYLLGANPGQYNTGNTGVRVGADGSFSFDNLSPGYMRLFARSSSANAELQSEIVDLHLEPPGASGVELALTPGGVVTGGLEIVGDGPSPVSGGKLAVSLSGMGPGIGFSPPAFRPLLFPVDESGAFRIVGITPGRFRLSVDGIPDSAYVKSILLDGAAVSDGILDFSRGVRGPAVKVTVGRDGAEISGEVRASDGGPVLNSRVSVFIAPEPGQMPLARSTAQIAGGRYILKGVPPGKYKIYAADLMSAALGASSASAINAARDALLAAAETLEVAAGSHVTKDLRVVSQEGPGGQPKQ